MSEEEQWSWWKVWSTSPVRSGWGRWGCLAWRGGGWDGTFSLSTAPWKEAAVRWGLVSSPKWLATGREEMASGCSRGGSHWRWGKISSPQGLSNTGTGCAGQWWSPCPWRCLKYVYRQRLGTRFSGGLGSVRLTVGLDLKGLFQPRWFYEWGENWGPVGLDSSSCPSDIQRPRCLGAEHPEGGRAAHLLASLLSQRPWHRSVRPWHRSAGLWRQFPSEMCKSLLPQQHPQPPA